MYRYAYSGWSRALIIVARAFRNGRFRNSSRRSRNSGKLLYQLYKLCLLMFAYRAISSIEQSIAAASSIF